MLRRLADRGIDYAVYAPSGKLAALVWVKRTLGTDGRWAADVRRSAIEHGGPLAGDLFMMVLPDRLYIWKAGEPPDAFPTYEVDARRVFAPYFERMGIKPEEIEREGFEMLVSLWLNELAMLRKESDPDLARIGLLDALEDAEIIRPAA